VCVRAGLLVNVICPGPHRCPCPYPRRGVVVATAPPLSSRRCYTHRHHHVHHHIAAAATVVVSLLLLLPWSRCCRRHRHHRCRQSRRMEVQVVIIAITLSRSPSLAGCVDAHPRRSCIASVVMGPRGSHWPPGGGGQSRNWGVHVGPTIMDLCDCEYIARLHDVHQISEPGIARRCDPEREQTSREMRREPKHP
jgi:hypothetical protein